MDPSNLGYNKIYSLTQSLVKYSGVILNIYYEKDHNPGSVKAVGLSIYLNRFECANFKTVP